MHPHSVHRDIPLAECRCALDERDEVSERGARESADTGKPAADTHRAAGESHQQARGDYCLSSASS